MPTFLRKFITLSVAGLLTLPTQATIASAFPASPNSSHEAPDPPSTAT